MKRDVPCIESREFDGILTDSSSFLLFLQAAPSSTTIPPPKAPRNDAP